MKVWRVGSAEEFFNALARDMDAFGLHTVGHVNWPAEFPAKPDVKFAVAHTGTEILLKFFVSEEYTRACVAEDNGRVWTDSCVEFFIGFDDTGYYNLECTCTGRVLLGFRKQREVYTLAGRRVLDTIRRKPSLGAGLFTEKRGAAWTLEIVLPVPAFFNHSICSLSGVPARGNFYKCGDELPVPHFLSWKPIDNPTPDFHLEKFFGDLVFE